ncbi:hypothetical protein D5R40_09925 [Okeania hirsuta]|uniref:Uncharacterized protein n=1 Tax=Okeania hirsuta TaxID=1458930 RepID=A0A3N6PXG9_9CYAN|nr:hypothetical protein D4Z78_19945 [Okeania hirsuta]RQH46201.1 hypothetical protein D5R40_09925 [Okeania hirsuta]
MVVFGIVGLSGSATQPTAVSSLKMWVKNLTPQPPSLQGKGEKLPSPRRRGVGGEVPRFLLLIHNFSLDTALQITSDF